ncbi:MAG: alkaline phosphatase family protein [Anaerolineales bacterium]|nr:alkaline phosphatase family protein [Anaerolineales bacterium]
MHIIIIFLDGIGLGENDPTVNPFAVMNTPTLHMLAGGQRWLRQTPRTESERAIFIPTDAHMGIAGRPQSATGQATILTGRNVPAELGEHYGPKPNPPIRAILAEDNLFKRLVTHGKKASLINPYPPGFFETLNRGKRLPSSIQDAALVAGVPLLTEQDYYQGQAISPDWTGEGWTHYLGYHDAPVYTPEAAGKLIGELARQHDLTFFSTWITDELGHRGPFSDAVAYMERFDRVMAGLLEIWDDDEGLIIITSDHGNMEVQGDRRHSENQVPTVVIGQTRHAFAEGFSSLVDITPRVLQALDLAP